MPWYISVGIYAIVGALSVVIALIVSKVIKKNMKAVQITLFAISLVLVKIYIMPAVTFWYVEKSFKEIPFYNIISEVEPDVYNSLQQELKNMLHEGKSQAQIVTTLRPRVISLLSKYFPYASDEAVVKSVTVTVEELKQLKAKSDDLCLKFLFPAKYGSVNLREYVNKEMLSKDLDAMNDVMISGAKNPQPAPDPKVAEQLLEKIAPNLYKEYGDDLAIIDDPANYDSNKNAVCSINISIYEEALSLPPKEASIILRYLVSENM